MDFSGIADRLSQSPVTAIPVLFAAGVLTSLTPCIYPMIPITAAIVGGTASGGPPRARSPSPHQPTSSGFPSSTRPRRLAGLTGSLFGTVSSNPWLYFGMANLLLFAALAMLVIIPVRLPAAFTARSATLGEGGRVGGAFLMGSASGLVAAPCSAPVMAAVLTWVSRTRNPVLGFTYLFAFSLGMCALLVVVGLSSGAVSRLPRAGVWMLWVKRFFALAMIGVAEYYLIKAGQGWF